jgi:hypothetical protein
MPFYDFDGLAGVESPSGNLLDQAISVIHVEGEDADAALLQVVVGIQVVILYSGNRRLP